MRKHLVVALGALIALLAMTAAAQADVFVRVPFVRVYVGDAPGSVVVSPPFIRPIVVDRPAPPPQPIIIGRPVDVPPVTTQDRVIVPEPRPAATPVVANRAPTLDEFAKTFKPAPGKYEVVIQHPVTCEPVTVCFMLPEGSPKKVRVHPRQIDFDYGKTDVTIRFIRDGRVRVTE
jgi:hypothetical protein